MPTERGDIVSYLLRQCSQRPLLSAKQEILLARDIRKWMDSDNPDARTIRKGQRAKQKLIEANMRLAVHNAKRFQKRIARSSNLSLEDLIQEAFIGLNRAAELFDPERGYKFSTYGTTWICQSIRKLIECQTNTIRVANVAYQLYIRWRYRPENQTLEEFAKAENRTVEYCKRYLEGFLTAQTKSLDHVVMDDDGANSTLMDFISTGDIDEETHEFADILHELHQIPEIKDSLAALELSHECKPAEVAEVLGIKTYNVKKVMRNHCAHIREHLPSDLRERLVGKEQKAYVKMKEQVPAFEVSPLKELALVNCCSSEPESMSEVSPNGHQSLEAEAVAVIAEVQSAEPVVEASKPTRRRRSKAEITAERAADAVSLSINGTSYEGSPQAIAAVLKAMAV